MEAISCSTPAWADLPADLLRDVAGRLHDASDLVRFHAVCQSWRDTDLSPATTVLQPCLLSRQGVLAVRYHLDFRCVDSSAESSYRRCDLVGVPFSHTLLLNWATTADGTAIFLLTVTVGLCLVTLTDLITGAVTVLPHLPPNASSIAHPTANSRGIIYGDGTIFLYNMQFVLIAGTHHYREIFTAAVLRPGDATWAVVKMSFNQSPTLVMHDLCAALHDGNVVLCIASTLSSYVMPVDGGGAVMTTPSHPMNGLMSIYFCSDPCYILESGGELLWVTVKYEERRCGCDLTVVTPFMSVAVHALESAPHEAAGKMRWVRRDGQSLIDRVLFLGSPYSFAMDAAQVGIAGGCVYLTSRSKLMRCNLVDGETTCMKLLPTTPGREDITLTWLRPKLAVAPIHDIRERLQARKKDPFRYKPTLQRRRRVNYLSKFMGKFTKCVKF